jgi:hypothetical protein
LDIVSGGLFFLRKDGYAINEYPNNEVIAAMWKVRPPVINLVFETQWTIPVDAGSDT